MIKCHNPDGQCRRWPLDCKHACAMRIQPRAFTETTQPLTKALSEAVVDIAKPSGGAFVDLGDGAPAVRSGGTGR